MIAAVMNVESSGNKSAVSSAGASGLMQLMPNTAKGLGVTDIFDPQQNIEAGAKYLKEQMNKFGDLNLAFAAYNAGPGAVDKAMKQAGSYKWDDVRKYLPEETQKYVPKVLMRMYAN